MSATREQIYCGGTPDEAFRAISDDLKTMCALIRLASASSVDKKISGENYIRVFAHWVQRIVGDLYGLHAEVRSDRNVVQVNDLLRRAHNSIGVPQWSYRLVNVWTGHGTIEVWREVAP